MSTVTLTCGLCGERAALDQPATGSIPPCPACGGVLALGNPVIFACRACGARSKPTTADPNVARPCPRCQQTLVLAPPSALAATMVTPLAQKTAPDPLSQATLLVGDAPAVAGGMADGAAFGPYRIERELARGGMGVVYIAVDPRLKRRVALKVMIAGDLAGTDAIRRFVREARAAGQLRHPNIVAVHDAGEIDGRHYFTMDLIKGRELSALIGGERSLADLVTLLLPVCDALEHAHEHGLVHRDLKPANIMVDEADRPIVMDFGLAKDVSGEASFRSLSGIVQGTPAYMSPEQARGNTTAIDRRTDVYALGVILYELATGRRPFGGDTLIDTIRAVVSDEPLAPASLAAEVDPAINAIILRCLEKDPAARYATAAALAADLRHWLAGEAVEAKAVAAPVRMWRRLRSKPRLLTGLAAALVVLLTIAIALTVVLTRDDLYARAAREVASGDPERARAAVLAVAAPVAEGQVASGDRDRALAVLRAGLDAGEAAAEAAALALGKAGDASAGPALITLASATGTKPATRSAALSELFALGPKAQDASAGSRTLANACRTHEPDTVRALVGTALALDRADGADALTLVAADGGVPATTRIAVIDALGAGDPTMVGPAMARLVRLAGDQDAGVGAAAARALERLRSTQAVFTVYGLGGRAGSAMAAAGAATRAVADRQRELDELSERMERSEAAPPEPTAVIAERLTASEPDTRATAAYDLGRIGGPGAVAPLTAALSDPDGGVRRSAGRSLATIAATTPVPWKPIAAQLAAKDPGIRADTARCLGGLEAREAASDLAATLSSEREARTRLALVEALGRIHDPAGLPALRAIANDKAATPELALAAVQALGAGKAHALAATPDLIAALRHSSRSVREAAATALATATGEDFGSDVERWMAWAAKAR